MMSRFGSKSGDFAQRERTRARCSRQRGEFVVEKGTTLNLGKIAPQSIYSGGADQVLLPRNIPENWVKNIKDLKTGKTYSLEEFKTAFPELIYKK
jgi:hypothetical protein